MGDLFNSHPQLVESELQRNVRHARFQAERKQITLETVTDPSTHTRKRRRAADKIRAGLT